MPLQLKSDTDSKAPQCPLRAARVALGKTQLEIAILVGVTPQVILLSEQGCYIDLPPTLLGTLSDLGKRAEWPAEALSALTLGNYRAWQRAKREYNASKWDPEISSIGGLYWDHCKGSASRLSKEILIPLRTAQDFVSGSVSSIIKEVCDELDIRLY